MNFVIPSEARDPQGPGRGPSLGTMKIPRLTARDDKTPKTPWENSYDPLFNT
jgi:hypothetical protein